MLSDRSPQAQPSDTPVMAWKAEFDKKVVAITRLIADAAERNKTTVSEVLDALLVKARGGTLDRIQESFVAYLNGNRVDYVQFQRRMETEEESGSQAAYLSWMAAIRESAGVYGRLSREARGNTVVFVKLVHALERELYTQPPQRPAQGFYLFLVHSA